MTHEYSGLDDPSRWVLLAALHEQGEKRPDAPWITTTDGAVLTFGEAADDARRIGGYLSSLGVERGERVAVMMTSNCDFVRAFFGLSAMGAVGVLLNTELRGDFLRHQLRNSGVETAIVDAEYIPAIEGAVDNEVNLKRLVVAGNDSSSSAVRLKSLQWSDWRKAEPIQASPPSAEDIACIMYTSGTSGPAKGVLMPHAHCALYGVGAMEAFEVGEADKYYIVLPLFHANGLLMQLGTSLLAGVEAVLRPRFSASAWLEDIRSHGATITHLLGALAAFVIGREPTSRDRDHRLRALLNGPNIAEHEKIFRERFGVADVISGFGMTEVNIPIWGRIGESRPGAAGWPHRHRFDVVIADPDTDRPVPPGELGEIQVRPKVPWGFMAGYHAMPEKTVEAWRNLWFHTGDAGFMDDDDLVTFVDRIKDCIRRRGENISASEVESVVAQIEGVAEVAAFAVKSDISGGEDEVMLAVVPAPGASLSPETVIRQADAALPRFARPRFVEFVEELPKTATGKVRHAALRERGATQAWDREADFERKE